MDPIGVLSPESQSRPGHPRSGTWSGLGAWTGDPQLESQSFEVGGHQLFGAQIESQSRSPDLNCNPGQSTPIESESS